jgi:hypothetical protein
MGVFEVVFGDVGWAPGDMSPPPTKEQSAWAWALVVPVVAGAALALKLSTGDVTESTMDQARSSAASQVLALSQPAVFVVEPGSPNHRPNGTELTSVPRVVEHTHADSSEAPRGWMENSTEHSAHHQNAMMTNMTAMSQPPASTEAEREIRVKKLLWTDVDGF